MERDEFCDYIIDFERLNYLTVSEHDGQKTGDYIPTVTKSLSKNLLKTYINEYEKVYSYYKDNIAIQEKPHHKMIFNTLIYNEVLVHKSKIRDKKIDQIVSDE